MAWQREAASLSVMAVMSRVKVRYHKVGQVRARSMTLTNSLAIYSRVNDIVGQQTKSREDSNAGAERHMDQKEVLINTRN